MENNIYYIQKIKNNDRMVLRNILLLLCVVSLAIVLIGVVACLGNKTYINLVYYAISLLIIFVIQFFTIFLCYELIIEYDSGMITMKKSYCGIVKTLFKANVKDVVIEKYIKKQGEKMLALCPKSCDLERYMIKLSGRSYLVNLDDYMYSLIEVKNDIS